MSSYQAQPKYYRYHLVILKVARKGLPMQDLAGGDNNRTPAIFQGVDIYHFVGDIHGARQLIYASNL